MTPPQRMTPREELEARWSSTFLSDLLRGDRAGQFAEGSDVCPRQMGWPPSTALHLSLVWAHLFLFGAAFLSLSVSAPLAFITQQEAVL